MYLVKKFVKIVKTEGLFGFSSRVRNLFVEFIGKLPSRIRRFLHRNPKSLLSNVSRYREDVRLTKQAQKKMRLMGLRTLADLDFAKIKRSDTLFILGSGASVNELREQDWDFIALCNSIGFNYWMAHPFVPDLYFTEPPPNEKIWAEYLNQYKACEQVYSDVPFIVNYKEWLKHETDYPLNEIPARLYKNLYHFAPYYLRINKPWLIRLVLRSWKRYLSQENRFDWLILQRASLGMLIMFGLFAGFKKIVLVGVDLSNTRYFFEEPSREFRYRPPNIQKGEVHRTVDDTLDINRISITIDKYIYLLNDVLLKPANVCLYVANEKSLLFPRLPLFKF